MLFEECGTGVKKQYFEGKTEPGKGCVCESVCMCAQMCSSKIGIHLNMLKRGERYI